MRAMPNRNVRIGARAAVVVKLMVRPVCPQLRKCPVRPFSYAWCHDRTFVPAQTDPHFESRGPLDIKGKGSMESFLLYRL
jgi:hypothetical protein